MKNKQRVNKETKTYTCGTKLEQRHTRQTK